MDYNLYRIVVIFCIFSITTAQQNQNPIDEYFYEDSQIVMKCDPKDGTKVCTWVTNTGNEYIINALPSDVVRSDTDSCSIKFKRPDYFLNQVWSCYPKGMDQELITYRINQGEPPTAPKFQDDKGLFIGRNEKMNFKDDFTINCKSINQGKPPVDSYSLNVTGVQNYQVLNNSVELKPVRNETYANLTCTVEHRFLKRPLITTVTVQLQDKPKIIHFHANFTKETNQEIFFFDYVSNPSLIEHEWFYEEWSEAEGKGKMVNRTITGNRRYNSTEIDKMGKKQLILVITNATEFIEADRKYYLRMINEKGVTEFGPFNAGDSITLHHMTFIAMGILQAIWYYRGYHH